MIYQISYISRSTSKLTPRELKGLEKEAAEKNTRLNVTGLLVYDGFHFFQYIEGDHNTIVELYERIKKDDRHTSVTTVSEGPSQERLFPDWAMRSFLPEDFILEDRVHIIEILSKKHEKESIPNILQGLKIRHQSA